MRTIFIKDSRIIVYRGLPQGWLPLVADKDSEKGLKKQLKEVKQQFEQLRQQLKRKIRIKLDTSKCTNGEVLKLNVRSTNIFYFDLDVETKNITNYVT